MRGATARRTENIDLCPDCCAATQRRRQTPAGCRTPSPLPFSNREAGNVFHDPDRRPDQIRPSDLRATPIRRNYPAICKSAVVFPRATQIPLVTLSDSAMWIPPVRDL